MLEKHEEEIKELSLSLEGLNLEDDRPDGYYFNPDRFGLVALVGTKVIGYTVWSHFPTFMLWDETVVHKDYRGYGLGKKLMHIRDVFTGGLVFGACYEENYAMVSILKSMGFHKCQLVPGQKKDMVMFARGHSH